MAKTRAEVLDAIIALGLTSDEADEELRGRERAGQRLIAAASPEGRAEALQLARSLIHSTQIHYVSKGASSRLEAMPPEPAAPLTVENAAGALASASPKAASQSPPAILEAWRGLVAWVQGPKWRPAVVIAGAVLGLSAVGLAAAGALDAPSKPTVYTAQTLGARVVALIPAPPPGPPPEAHVAASPAYEVRYMLNKKRLDGGKTLYVLVDPVDISNANFKDDLKLLIKDLVAQNGPSISIEVHDDPNSLRASYGRFGEKSTSVAMTPEESSNIALHFVAAFSGNLNTGMYLNTLQFYAAATPDTPFVGQYTEDIEFDPTQ